MAATTGGLLAGALRGSGQQAAESPLPEFRPRRPLAEGEPIRIGVIGTGRMGLAHCRAFAGMRRKGVKLDLVAVSDVCRPRLLEAQRVGQEFQAEVEVSAHRSYRELFERGLHGVVIATPVHWHAALTIEALAAGLDVYVEKPVANKLPEALAVHRVAQASDQIVQVGTQLVREPKYAAARELLASGALGAVTSAQTSYCRNSREGEWRYPIDPSVEPGEQLDWEAWCGPLGAEPWNTEIYHRWPGFRRYSTGILGDLLVHVLTPMVWTLNAGWPLRVSATGAHLLDLAMENHDQVNLNVQFASGAILSALGSTCNEQGLETVIRGHEATLQLGGNHCVLTPERINEDADPSEQRFEGIYAQQAHRQEWIQCIRSRQQPLGDTATAAQVAAILDLASRSLWDGGTWELDPDSLQPRRA